MKVWTRIPGTIDSGYVDINIGDEVTVFRCGLGQSVFGERAHLRRATSQHLIFVNESGAEVKTVLDNLFDVRGKAKAAGYGVTLRKVDGWDKLYHEQISYWNQKKLCFEKK